MLGGRFTRSDSKNTICRDTVGEIVMKYQGYLNNVISFFLKGFIKCCFSHHTYVYTQMHVHHTQYANGSNNTGIYSH